MPTGSSKYVLTYEQTPSKTEDPTMYNIFLFNQENQHTIKVDTSSIKEDITDIRADYTTGALYNNSTDSNGVPDGINSYKLENFEQPRLVFYKKYSLDNTYPVFVGKQGVVGIYNFESGVEIPPLKLISSSEVINQSKLTTLG